MNGNQIALRVVAGILGIALLWTGCQASAEAHQPYGGCKEAWQAPASWGAEHCREHGWTVRARLVVNQHGVVVMSRLPRCRYEDGSSQAQPCSWNFTPGDGNSRGLALWYDARDRAHFVWAKSPIRSNWEWVTRRQGDRLARSERAYYRKWEACITRQVRRSTRVVCADGLRVRS